MVALSLTMNLPKSPALSALIWITGAPALLIAELVLQYLHQHGWYPAPPGEFGLLRLCVLTGAWFLWIASVLAPVLFGLRLFGSSLLFSQGFALMIGSAVSAFCYELFLHLADGGTNI